MRLAISIVLGLVLLTGSYVLYQNLADSKKPPRGQANKTTNTVFVKPVENGDSPIFIETNGTIRAQERIELFSEVQGVLKQTKKAFKPGQRYGKGEMLLEMDSQEFYSSLVAQRSILYNNIVSIMPDLKFDLPESFQPWQTYLDEFDIQGTLKELPKAQNEKEKYFINSKQIVSTYYTIKNLEERLVKYQIKAPFSGILTEALVDPGTLVRTGQKLGALINPSVFELEANINAEYLEYLKVGKRVSVSDLKGQNTWVGFVKRINGVIDPTTQTVQAFIQISGKNLTEGMFLEASVMAKTESNVLEISRSLLSTDNTVFVVENDSVLTMHAVEVIHFSDKTALVRGLKNGAYLMSKPLPGAYDGMIVKVSNQ
ncbi:efflux RND transporter periplasmic adaptor subunit [Arcticibacterium luteifluviistationis]|uniref:Efflux transporter periplasmic adaptor subunit n=1 Tax=Arcticibacterium luteifluviistationis TaxID=1784714 RepID=A0A2Z4GAP0_9BACT|nr:HlyD family efflux transporter periplasmic adaptor subunit [Arcticibacterium luteifluviistationis]AWV98003.1 efflux transporter periplasmic adaptor subunit [Arcticibacterium luteifluviistationis]